MSGVSQAPAERLLIVQVAGLDGHVEGIFAGCSIAVVRQTVAQHLPQYVIPADYVPTVMTLDPEADGWKAVAAPERHTLMSVKVPKGVAIYEGVSKPMPETYILGPADVFLEFHPATP